MRPSWLLVSATLVGASSSVTCKDEEVSVCTTAVEASEDEIPCGTYESPDDDPCAEPVEAEPCASQQANNDEVEACVLQAVSEGAAFEYAVRSGSRDGQYGSTSTIHVTADGPMWRELHTTSDQCSTRSTAVYEAVSLEDCADWNCVRDRVAAAKRVAECEEDESCEGV